MAAQKLTKGRLVQIIVMLAILVAAFTWRTVTYTDHNTTSCIVSQPCRITINEHNVVISSNKSGFLIETSKTGNFDISTDKGATLTKNSSTSWQLTTRHKVSMINVTFPQQDKPFQIELTKQE